MLEDTKKGEKLADRLRVKRCVCVCVCVCENENKNQNKLKERVRRGKEQGKKEREGERVRKIAVGPKVDDARRAINIMRLDLRSCRCWGWLRTEGATINHSMLIKPAAK